MALQPGPQRTRFFVRWGARVRKRAIENALGKGGRHLWRQIARSVNIEGASADGVTILTRHVAAAQKQYGGVIRARGKAAGGADALTIPIADEAQGQTAAKFALGGRKLFALGNVLGYSEDSGEFHGLFALVRETKPQRASPWWPEPEWVEEVGVNEAKTMLGF